MNYFNNHGHTTLQYLLEPVGILSIVLIGAFILPRSSKLPSDKTTSINQQNLKTNSPLPKQYFTNDYDDAKIFIRDYHDGKFIYYKDVDGDNTVDIIAKGFYTNEERKISSESHCLYETLTLEDVALGR